MKIIQVDKYDRESVAEVLVAENIQDEHFGKLLLNALNATSLGPKTNWYRLVTDDHKLWRGMKELV